VSVQKVPFARLAQSGNVRATSHGLAAYGSSRAFVARAHDAGLRVVNEQFPDKRNAANGTLWTDINYCLER